MTETLETEPKRRGRPPKIAAPADEPAVEASEPEIEAELAPEAEVEPTSAPAADPRPDPDGWLPVESAPINGQRITLKLDNGHMAHAEWFPTRTYDRLARSWKPSGYWIGVHDKARIFGEAVAWRK